MSVMDLYDYALTIGLTEADLAAEGVVRGQQTVAVPNVMPAGTTTPGTTTVGGLSPNQLLGQAIILATLRQYGLDTPELIQWAKDSIANNATADQLNLELYDPGSTPGKVVAQLYPEIQARQKKGLTPVSIGEVVTYRHQATQLLRAAGLPETFYDQPDDFTSFISNDVSLSELSDRITKGYVAAQQSAPDVKAQLQQLYGIDDSHLAALMLDPQRALPAILRQFDSAQIAAAGVRSTYGQIGAGTAEQLAAQGVNPQDAEAGFGKLAQLRPLRQLLPGEGGTAVTEEQGLAAQFGGDVAAQKAIEDERKRRLATFGGGGGFGAGQRGVAGLGSAAG